MKKISFKTKAGFTHTPKFGVTPKGGGFTPTLTFTKQRSCALGAHCKSKCRGFTIIETMIAVSLFIIIVMMGMDALLNANALHQKSQNMRSILDNLSFVMEDMSRNLRTGYDYRCITSSDDLVEAKIETAQSSPVVNGSTQSCWGIAFEYQNGTKGNPSDQWVYYIDSNTPRIFKATNDNIGNSYANLSNYVQLTPDEVNIDVANSFFMVTGAELSDKLQPFVTIKLVGTINTKGVTRFSLQTSVSQRQIDI